jgi:hypothetical protein
LALVKISSIVAIFEAQSLPSRSSIQEQLAQDTSAPTFWEAPAGGWDGWPGRSPALGTEEGIESDQHLEKGWQVPRREPAAQRDQPRRLSS